MSKITIENYRGIDIEFDTFYEKFQCIIMDEYEKESKSFSAIKKYIDDYRKNNQNFKPFYVEGIPNREFEHRDGLKIIGLRKDERFVAEMKNGEKTQIPEYDINKYMLVKDENKKYLSLLNDLDNERKDYMRKYEKREKDIISKIDIVDLKEYKSKLVIL